MTPRQRAQRIMRAIQDPKAANPDDAVAFIEAVADTLCECWNDPSKHELTCVMLLEGFRTGKLALVASKDALIIVDGKTGEPRVKLPVDPK